MPQVDIVVIGASAGGLQALIDIVERLPSELRPPVLIAVHTRSEGDSYLPQILSRRSHLPVAFATDGEAIVDGRIYVAPPDFHLLVQPGRVKLSHGPRENGFRPAVDPLFRSAARVYGEGVMAVILSGGLDDGSYGLKVVKDRGGMTVVQDPAEAAVPSMPLSALRVVDVDYTLPAAQIGELIATTRAVAARGEPIMAPNKEPDPQLPEEETEVEEMEQTFGPPSALTCPDCGGALWEIQDGAMTRYRCHVGHQFTTESLDAEQQTAVEGALWAAVRVLEEHSELRQRMADRAAAAGMEAVSSGFAESALDSHRQAHTIRALLFGRTAQPAVPEPVPVTAATAKAAGRSPNGPGVKGNGRGRRTRRAR